MAHVGLLKRLAVVAAAGLLALGLGAATASAAEIIDGTNPSGEISDSLQW